MGRESSSSSSSSDSDSSSSDASEARASKLSSRDDREDSSSGKGKRKSSRSRKEKDSKKRRSSKDGKKKKKKSDKDKKKHKKKKSRERERERVVDDDTLSQKDIDAIVASQRRAKNPSAEAALSEKEAFKKQVLEAAAKAHATLATGELQRQKTEMLNKHNAFGGEAVDWHTKRKMNKALQAQKRMVAVGKQLLEKEKRDKANMAQFMSAVRVLSLCELI